jgi:hypothetical protein
MRFITLKEDGVEMIIDDGKAVRQLTFFMLKKRGMEMITEEDMAGASTAPEEEQA